uniref:Uncharacterized protein n=1 Tax=Zea mays TaxID=4577 RepID=C4J5C2_MAIZE|nr:unknown [Zea mays]ACR36473.1 unknown [Zea mays]
MARRRAGAPARVNVVVVPPHAQPRHVAARLLPRQRLAPPRGLGRGRRGPRRARRVARPRRPLRPLRLDRRARPRRRHGAEARLARRRGQPLQIALHLRGHLPGLRG